MEKRDTRRREYTKESYKFRSRNASYESQAQIEVWKERPDRYRKPNDEQLEHFNNEINDNMKEYLANNYGNPGSFLEAFIKHLSDSAKDNLTEIDKHQKKS